ncbi:MAG: pyridoxal-phosphate dependent enzyme, partial [Oscillospiraceae bacterium]
MKIYHSITELMGSTPLLQLRNLEARHDLPATLLVKLECHNPAGSSKDRVALHMITEAERAGEL